MKTATIRVNLLFGTHNEFAADISYRGRVLKTFMQNGTAGLAELACTWATNQGFTHIRLIFG